LRRPILLLTRELGLGGSERQLAETALTLDRERFEPHVGCFHAGGLRAPELRDAGIPIVELGVRSLISSSALAGAGLMGRYLTHHNIQLVHAFDVPMDLFAVPVARLFRVRVVLASQRAHRGLTPGITRHLLHLTDRMVDGIVVNSLAVARDLIAEDAVPRSLIRLVYNGLDTGVFCREGVAAARPWQQAEAVIGVVCALRPEKGLPLLLDAFARVRATRPGIRLLIVGSGPILPDLEERARWHGLGSDCRFQPAVQDVAEWLRLMDIFVLPSLSESLSNSLMEAMACGCCAIASDAGGNPEIITAGESGLLFPTGDTAALAARLETVLDSPEYRRILAGNAAHRVRERFSRQAAAGAMSEIYLEYLEGP
jgi:glycosyltransferase involved in cell wall biosynthesis